MDYLTLPEGQTTLKVVGYSGFKYVHFPIENGKKRKRPCFTNCSHCQAGDRRVLRMTMTVEHNGDDKLLEVGASLGNHIVNSFVIGDSFTIDRQGTGLHTRYKLIGIPVHTKNVVNTTSLVDREEGMRELFYDLQRTTDDDEKYALIKDFARKY